MAGTPSRRGNGCAGHDVCVRMMNGRGASGDSLRSYRNFVNIFSKSFYSLFIFVIFAVVSCLYRSKTEAFNVVLMCIIQSKSTPSNSRNLIEVMANAGYGWVSRNMTYERRLSTLVLTSRNLAKFNVQSEQCNDRCPGDVIFHMPEKSVQVVTAFHVLYHD